MTHAYIMQTYLSTYVWEDKYTLYMGTEDPSYKSMAMLLYGWWVHTHMLTSAAVL